MVNLFTYLFAVSASVLLPLRLYFTANAKKGNLPVWYIFSEYSLLFFLLYKALEEHAVAVSAIGISLPRHASIEVSNVLICCSIVIALDSWSLQKLLKKRKYNIATSVNKEYAFPPTLKFSNNIFLNKLLLLLFCIVSGFWEEVVFRGLLFFILGKIFLPLPLTILITSLVFGVYHFSKGIGQVIYSFFFGLLFATLYVLTGSLPAVIICHILGNAFVLFVSVPLLNKKPSPVIFC